MRYSLTNHIEGSSTTLVNAVQQFGSPSNLTVLNTHQAYGIVRETAADVELRFEFAPVPGFPGSTRVVDMVSLVNVTGVFPGIIEIELYLSGVLQASAAAELRQPVQLNYVTATFPRVFTDEVRLRTQITADTTLGLGYLYAGQLSQSIKAANFNYGIASADPRSISRAGTSVTSQTYVNADISFTIVEESFDTLRSRVVDFATTGFATPRLWHFDSICESCIMTGETLFGVLDSNRLQLDAVFESNTKAKAVTTLGITEVF